MSYSIGQYFHIANTDGDKFKTELTNVTEKPINTEVIVGSSTISFTDCGYALLGSYQANKKYYMCCEISSLSTDQVIFVKLINNTNSSKMQYIKTITIAKNSGTHIIDFIFSPLERFDTLVFELQRISEDFTQPRVVSVKRKELSEINNILGTLINATELVKIGVQADSGTKMCINNEEIMIGRSGIYEIKNGIITIDFFSVVSLGNTIPAFTLDYIYEEEDN